MQVDARGGSPNFVALPLLLPRSVAICNIGVVMETMLEGAKPLSLIYVEFLHVDVTYLSPRLVLEGVVIKELAAEDERHGEHLIEATFGGDELTFGGQATYADREV